MCCSLLTRRCSATRSQAQLQSPLQAVTRTGHSATARVSSSAPACGIKGNIVPFFSRFHLSCTLGISQVLGFWLPAFQAHSHAISLNRLHFPLLTFEGLTPDQLLCRRAVVGQTVLSVLFAQDRTHTRLIRGDKMHCTHLSCWEVSSPSHGDLGLLGYISTYLLDVLWHSAAPCLPVLHTSQH